MLDAVLFWTAAMESYRLSSARTLVCDLFSASFLCVPINVCVVVIVTVCLVCVWAANLAKNLQVSECTPVCFCGDHCGVCVEMQRRPGWAFREAILDVSKCTCIEVCVPLDICVVFSVGVSSSQVCKDATATLWRFGWYYILLEH